MLVPKKLTIKAFGRFVDQQTVDFTQLGDIAQLEGSNNNTPGSSSGSGKTTLIHALEYNLGLNDLPIGTLQSRLTKEGLYTLGEYDNDGTLVIIERGKSKFSVTNGDTVVSGSSKLTEEELDKIIGMPRDLFKKILHKAQGSHGFFLEFTPSKMHEFMVSTLGLEKEQEKLTPLDTRLDKLKTEDNLVWNSYLSSERGVEATKEAIVILGPSPTLKIDQEAIDKFKVAYNTAVESKRCILENNKKEIEELEKNRPQIEVVRFDRSKIEELEREIEKANNDLTELKKKEMERQSLIKTEISSIEVEIEKYNSAELARQNEAKAKIPPLEARIVGLNNAEIARQNEVKGKISQIRLELQKLEQKETERQGEVRNKISTNKVNRIKAEALIAQGNDAKAEAVKIKAELDKIKASLCPTCDQSWVNDAAKARQEVLLGTVQELKKKALAGAEATKEMVKLDEERALLDQEVKPKEVPEKTEYNEKIVNLTLLSAPQPIPEIEEIKQQIDLLIIQSNPQQIPQVADLKQKIDLLTIQGNDSPHLAAASTILAAKRGISESLSAEREKESSHQFKENAKRQLILDNYAKKQTEMREEHEKLLEHVTNQERKASEELSTAKHQVGSFEKEHKKYQDSLDALNKQLNTYLHDFQISSKKREEIKEEIEMAEESKKIIKSYLSAKFEDALDSIGDTATRLIRSIPNMATASIQFEGLKETKEGKIKEEVTCTLGMDGEIAIPIKSISGGERSSTDLAVDLAVIKFIEEQTGKGIDLFILDEPFTGLDSPNILEALEMLRECSGNKRLLIVDHNPMAAQVMENKITVVRDGQVSRIVQ